jgi:simple sugar transport system ATP-binding protein
MSAPRPQADAPLLRVVDISKRFGDVVANAGITFDVHAGKVLCLLGENGAGKTSLMNILYGLYKPDDGKLYWLGKKVRIASPADALELGIGMVHQRFMLVNTLTTTENLMLVMPGLPLVLRKAFAERAVRDLSEQFGIPVHPSAKVAQLSLGERQRIEILKSLVRQAKLLILDEPTSILAPQEVETLWATLTRLRDAGFAVVLITHKLPEARAIADRIVVLRRGRVVGDWQNSEVDDEQLLRAILGADSESEASPQQMRVHDSAIADLLGTDRGTALHHNPRRKPGDVVVSLRSVSTSGQRVDLNGVSLEICRGQVLGVAGVDGNGQRTLARLLAGIEKPARGDLLWHTPTARIGFVPADRLGTGLVGTFNVTENLLTRTLNDRQWYVLRGRILAWRRLRDHAARLIDRYSIHATPWSEARHLSGGNQQKLVLARETFGSQDILVIEQPTQGLDVAAAAAVIRQVQELADGGAAVVWISSNLDELIQEADRLVILYQGRIAGEASAHPDAAYDAGRLMVGLEPKEGGGRLTHSSIV